MLISIERKTIAIFYNLVCFTIYYTIYTFIDRRYARQPHFYRQHCTLNDVMENSLVKAENDAWQTRKRLTQTEAGGAKPRPALQHTNVPRGVGKARKSSEKLPYYVRVVPPVLRKSAATGYAFRTRSNINVYYSYVLTIRVRNKRVSLFLPADGFIYSAERKQNFSQCKQKQRQK